MEPWIWLGRVVVWLVVAAFAFGAVMYVVAPFWVTMRRVAGKTQSDPNELWGFWMGAVWGATVLGLAGWLGLW